MPGPTTEVLNEELREVRSDLATMRADVHAVALAVARLDDVRGELAGARTLAQSTAVDLAEFRGEVRLFMRVATWGGALLVATALSSGIAGVWWAATLTGEVRQLGQAMGKVEARVSGIESTLKVGTPAAAQSPPKVQ